MNFAKMIANSTNFNYELCRKTCIQRKVLSPTAKERLSTTQWRHFCVCLISTGIVSSFPVRHEVCQVNATIGLVRAVGDENGVE